MTYKNLSLTPPSTELPPNPYQEFYLTTPAGEKSLTEKLANDPDQVAACKKRLAELENLLSQDDNRCHASRDQRNFLRRMLLLYMNP